MSKKNEKNEKKEVKFDAIPSVDKFYRRADFVEGPEGDDLWYNYMCQHLDFRNRKQREKLDIQFKNLKDRTDPKLKIQNKIDKLRKQLMELEANA